MQTRRLLTLQALTCVIILPLILSFATVLRFYVPPVDALLPTLVQNKTHLNSGTNNNDSFVCVLVSTPAYTDVLILTSIACDSSRMISNISWTGVTWARAVINVQVEIWYGIVFSSGFVASSGIVTYSGSVAWDVDVFEYRGINASSPFDKSATASGTTELPLLTGTTATISSPYELCVGAIFSYTATNGENDQSSNNATFNFFDGTSYDYYATYYQSLATLTIITSATGSYQGSTTVSHSSVWDGAIATFKVVSAQFTAYSSSRTPPVPVGSSQYFLLNATVDTVSQWQDVCNFTWGLDNGVQLNYDNATNTFSKPVDDSNYCTLSSAGNSVTKPTSTSMMTSWNVSFSSSMPTGYVSVNITSALLWVLISGIPTSFTGTVAFSNLFYFVNDLSPVYNVARFEFSPTNPVLGDIVSFDATQTVNVTAISDYSWNFGDGNVTHGPALITITHAFVVAGSYNVSLTLTGTGLDHAFTFHTVDVHSGASGATTFIELGAASLAVGVFLGAVFVYYMFVIHKKREAS
jgi:hypothetical protein